MHVSNDWEFKVRSWSAHVKRCHVINDKTSGFKENHGNNQCGRTVYQLEKRLQFLPRIKGI